MKYCVGDRVKSVCNFFGVKAGEAGVIQFIHGDGTSLCSIAVRWDEFNRYRHDNDGRCEKGHGYLVLAKDIELVSSPVSDLGELPSVEIYDTELLFGM